MGISMGKRAEWIRKNDQIQHQEIIKLYWKILRNRKTDTFDANKLPLDSKGIELSHKYDEFFFY